MDKEAIRQFFSYLSIAGILIYILSGWFDWSNTVRYIAMAMWSIGVIDQLVHWRDNSRSNNIINIIIIILMIILLVFPGK